MRLGGVGPTRPRSGNRPTLQVSSQARALHLAVFFITGRPENERTATERNLAAVGYTGYAKLYMVPNGAHFVSAADFKAPIRREIERAGYTIIENMGDQPSDLIGGHAEKEFLLPRSVLSRTVSVSK
jgi:hypothetical protein